MSDGDITNPNELLDVPKWINEDYFIPILEQDIPDYDCITKLHRIAATAPGENYSSIMVRVIIDVGLKDGTFQRISYILKTVLDWSNEGAAFVSAMNLFPKEKQMYISIIPKLEKLYKDAGLEVKLGPKCLHIDEAPDRITIVMEDLSREQFHNIDRLQGFDMEQMHIVLTKLAEFHAASAVYAIHNGPFEPTFHYSFFNEANRSMFEALYEPRKKLFEEAIMQWGLPEKEKYIAKTPTYDEFYDENFFLNTVNPNEFNVLNHGDCWSNNIMFQQDEFGKVQQALFVDFQICKWGSPAQDLWYLITTSVDLSIKIKEFDQFIQIYHKHLVECLKLLNYKKDIPSLKNLHTMMLKYGYWGVFTANSIAPATLFPPDKQANMGSFLKAGSEADNFRFKAFTNPIYVRAMLQFYPFLYNKGLFDISAKNE